MNRGTRTDKEGREAAVKMEIYIEISIYIILIYMLC